MGRRKLAKAGTTDAVIAADTGMAPPPQLLGYKLTGRKLSLQRHTACRGMVQAALLLRRRHRYRRDHHHRRLCSRRHHQWRRPRCRS
jgi:hypothetical protein